MGYPMTPKGDCIVNVQLAQGAFTLIRVAMAKWFARAAMRIGKKRYSHRLPTSFSISNLPYEYSRISYLPQGPVSQP